MVDGESNKKEFFIRVNQNTNEIINIQTTKNSLEGNTPPKNPNLSNFISQQFNIINKASGDESCGENDKGFVDTGEFDDDEFDDVNLKPDENPFGEVEGTYKESVSEKIKGMLESSIASQIKPVIVQPGHNQSADPTPVDIEKNIENTLVSEIETQNQKSQPSTSIPPSNNLEETINKSLVQAIQKQVEPRVDPENQDNITETPTTQIEEQLKTQISSEVANKDPEVIDNTAKIIAKITELIKSKLEQNN